MYYQHVIRLHRVVFTSFHIHTFLLFFIFYFNKCSLNAYKIIFSTQVLLYFNRKCYMQYKHYSCLYIYMYLVLKLQNNGCIIYFYRFIERYVIRQKDKVYHVYVNINILRSLFYAGI